MDKSFGFNLSRAIIVGFTSIIQFALILNVSSAPIPYLLSNISIVSGFILDLISLMKINKTLHRFILDTVLFEAGSIVLGLGDIFIITNYQINNNFFTHILIPILTLLGLDLYLLICIIILIKTEKDENCFN